MLPRDLPYLCVYTYTHSFDLSSKWHRVRPFINDVMNIDDLLSKAFHNTDRASARLGPSQWRWSLIDHQIGLHYLLIEWVYRMAPLSSHRSFIDHHATFSDAENVAGVWLPALIGFICSIQRKLLSAMPFAYGSWEISKSTIRILCRIAIWLWTHHFNLICPYDGIRWDAWIN